MLTLSRHSKTAVLFIGFIVTIIILNIMMPDKEFSESENRVLQQAPKFSIKRLLDGKFTLDYEKYISDQIAYRDFWIGVKANAEQLLGKKDNNGVFLGSDGYLFQTFEKPNLQSLNDKVAAINSFALSNPDAKIYFLLAPNSVKVLEDKLPPYASPEDQLEYINKVRKKLNNKIKFIDVYDTLVSKKDEYIFYKTDHHWTTNGAYYAYSKAAFDLGFTPNDKKYFKIKKVASDFYGSLYSKSGFRNLKPDNIELFIPKYDEKYKVYYYDKDEVDTSLYKLDNLKKKDKYTVFFNGNHPLIQIETNNKSGKKILIAKDSFANSFIPFLTAHYSQIYVVDLRYYNDDINSLIKEHKIEEILILYSVNTFFEDTSIERISW